jgi:hypothetical protein
MKYRQDIQYDEWSVLDKDKSFTSFTIFPLSFVFGRPLFTPHFSVMPIVAQQLRVRTTLRNVSFIQNNNFVYHQACIQGRYRYWKSSVIDER